MDGLVDVLRRWSRSWERPVAVVGMPLRRYPTLVRSVAETHCGGWPAPAGPRANDQRAPAGGRRLGGRTGQGPALPHGSRAGVSFTGPVLLVDSTIRTRWTATVAAALLADAGAISVLPLAIHQLP